MNIEEIIKSSLENSEMPYDPKAWEAMSARLDQALPASTAPKTSWKWSWVAAVVAVAGISTFFLVDKENKKTAKEAIAVVVPAEEKSGETTAEKGSEPIVTAENKAEKIEDSKVPAAETQNFTGSGSASCSGLPGPRRGEGSGPQTIPSIPATEVKAFTYTSPEVNDRYCENEKISIKNSNDYPITLVSENRNSYMIEAGRSLSVELSEVGNYSFTYQKHGKTIHQEAFKVQAKPKADFYANDETLYDNGLPINTVKSAYPASEYTWTNAKGEVLSREKEADIHLFTKGQHDITLKVEGNNGCTSVITKPVRCEINYNLLAMNGFNPESASEKNRTFIPYALLERNIPFEMEIIDPKTGQVVYATKNEPWDGINRITNQMIPEGSTYMWRVTIYKKEIGEPKNVYQGGITRM